MLNLPQALRVVRLPVTHRTKTPPLPPDCYSLPGCSRSVPIPPSGQGLFLAQGSPVLAELGVLRASPSTLASCECVWGSPSPLGQLHGSSARRQGIPITPSSCFTAHVRDPPPQAAGDC